MMDRSSVSTILGHLLAGSAVAAALAMGAASARASTIAYGTALTAPSFTIDFSGLADDTPIAGTYATADGVTFNGLYATDFFGSTLPGTTAPAAVNYTTGNASSPSAISISFAAPVTAAQFYLRTDGYGTTITSSLNGATVESVQAGTFNQTGADYFGFTNSSFDTITLTVSQTGTALIDNFQAVDAAAPALVPEPGSSTVLLAGLAGLMALGARRHRI